MGSPTTRPMRLKEQVKVAELQADLDAQHQVRDVGEVKHKEGHPRGPEKATSLVT